MSDQDAFLGWDYLWEDWSRALVVNGEGAQQYLTAMIVHDVKLSPLGNALESHPSTSTFSLDAHYHGLEQQYRRYESW